MTDPTPTAVTVTERPEAAGTIEVRPMPWYAAIGVRVVRTYLQALVGFIGAAFVLPAVLPDGSGLVLGPYADRLVTAAQLAALPAFMSLLQNALEILGKLDATNPQLRA